MGVRDDIAGWIDTALLIFGSAPPIASALFALIQQFGPDDVKQEWTYDKTLAFVMSYRERQEKRKQAFDDRRTEEPEE